MEAVRACAQTREVEHNVRAALRHKDELLDNHVARVAASDRGGAGEQRLPARSVLKMHSHKCETNLLPSVERLVVGVEILECLEIHLGRRLVSGGLFDKVVVLGCHFFPAGTRKVNGTFQSRFGERKFTALNGRKASRQVLSIKGLSTRLAC